VGIASLILEPFYFVIKKNLQSKARRVIQANHSKNIMIVGSYGKTTTTNFINQLLQYSFKSQMVAGNINTPTGIAAWILKNFDKNVDILVAETDGYKLGEIRDCCKIISGDYVIITAIGDQHLERLGSRTMLARTLIEAITYSKPNAKIILFKETLEDFNALGFNLTEMFKDKYFIIIDHTEDISYMGRKLKTDHLSEADKYDLCLALEVVKLLDVPDEYIQDSVDNLILPERRNQKIKKEDFDTIDNSYNISFNTAVLSLETAVKEAKTQEKELIVITAGIPELGNENASANKDYGIMLAKSCVKEVVLLKTNVALPIYKELWDAKKKTKTVSSMIEAWKYISTNYKPSNVFVLMQPELNDLYYIDTNFSSISEG
jgi:UDP-N-acetylmuramoyl-tripeptide--D-alanyl-D-alanine ligase